MTVRSRRKDFRREPAGAWRGELSSFLSSNRRAFGLLIGHGDDIGARFCGVRAEEIQSTGDYTHLWFHACSCGKRFSPRVAELGIATYGFVTNVLAGTGNGVEFKACLSAVKRLNSDASAQDVKRAVQAAWRNLAYDFLSRRHDIFGAAAISHLRLGLRAFEPASRSRAPGDTRPSDDGAK